MPELLHKCLAKGLIAEGDQRKYGPNWVTSRRGTLKVFDDHLEFGDWRIDFTEIKNAVLTSFRSSFLRIPGYVLTIETETRSYHFGLNGWGRFWKGGLPFQVTREKGSLQFTWFSIFLRAILIGYVAYLVWKWISTS